MSGLKPLQFRRVVVREFWGLVAGGMPVTMAAVAVGVSQRCGLAWFTGVGGVRPRLVEPGSGPRSRLSFVEREQIMVGVATGESVRSMARRLGRAPSTIMREIARNGTRQRGRRPERYRRGHRFGARRGGMQATVAYTASLAQRRAEMRSARPKPRKLALDTRLGEEVADRLSEGHSPAQIAARLRQDFANDERMRISHEAIYQSIYVQGRGGLRRELHACLRSGRGLRKPRRRDGEPRGRIKDMVNISDRPAEVEDRSVPGNWEGDLIVGTESKSAIGTLVERSTGFVMLLHLPTDHTALAVQEAIVAKMSGLPSFLRQTLTWDQGKEMANHVRIAAATDLDIYFCDPHSPWQRGTNENTNGLLRQYFPKGQDLSIFPADYLDFIAARLNNRPRKRHNWATPAEKLDQLLSNPSNFPVLQ